MPSRWFPQGAVASPHHLASAVGARVLADGGNAVDAAVATNLVLAVVTPYHCGAGGDLLALVHHGSGGEVGDGHVTGVHSIGAMPAGASPDAVRAAIADGHGSVVALPGTDGMPTFGALPVTVPGAVAGWFHLVARWGSRTFGHLAAPAIALAADGFPPSAQAAGHVERSRPVLGDQPGWADTYGTLRAGRRFVQRELAASLRRLADDGPDALYAGPLGQRVVEVLADNGSTMTAEDLRAHRVAEVAPLTATFRDLEVLELPPPTQGVTAATALGVLDRLPARGTVAADLAAHHEVEAVRLALRDRQRHLGDPRTMTTTPDRLLAADRLDELAATVDDGRAADLELGPPVPGGTAYLCAVDRDGLAVSLIQSNFVGFGSGVVAPGTGIGLHDRGAHLRLDAPVGASNALVGGAVPLHTLIPGMTRRDGAFDAVFGTMGGDGQAQIHAQLLRRVVDDRADLQDAIDAPRWIVDLADGAIVAESRTPHAVLDGLRERGHTVRVVGPYEHGAGHAHALRVTTAGVEGASDPRCEGAVTGH